VEAVADAASIGEFPALRGYPISPHLDGDGYTHPPIDPASPQNAPAASMRSVNQSGDSLLAAAKREDKPRG